MKKIYLPLTHSDIKNLHAGDEVLISGIIYTARDQAHKKLFLEIAKRKKPPFDLNGAVIYYCGPTPARPGAAIGSCGPTTSKRMDRFTPRLLKAGVSAMIGKGRRSKEVIDAIKRHRSIYFVCIGGAGAYIASRVNRSCLVGYKELGPEAIYQLEVIDFPVIVGIDSKGKSIFSRR